MYIFLSPICYENKLRTLLAVAELVSRNEIGTADHEILKAITNAEIFHIEHVNPIVPSQNIAQHPDDQTVLLTNALGNLTLWYGTDNVTLQNKTLLEKLPMYKTSSVKITQEISEDHQGKEFLDSSDIIARQKFLVEKIVRFIEPETLLSIEPESHCQKKTVYLTKDNINDECENKKCRNIQPCQITLPLS